ncbi:uncharacterized protein [Euphorbia lathyris]|uniref:uncharacterized protein n=1 Tax=Euphorbia lathyris TaxID=212925 RepID=UPI003313AAD1
MTPSLRLTSTSISILTYLQPLPPKRHVSKQNIFSERSKNLHDSPTAIRICRREAAFISFLALVPSLSKPDPAAAFSIGISGPKDWLKEQKKKASKFLLAPIDASRESLRSAYLLLTASESEYTIKELEEVQRLYRSASRDCIPEDRNSFVAFQANTGVEVCTFRLIVKNASSLLDKKDPVKLEAEAMLNDLIRSFSSLNDIANETDIQVSSDRKKISDALTNTISSLDKFEQLVMDCLEV